MYLLILTPPTSLDNKNRMACGIILCGASSIGKSTLAQEWCTKHVEYARIEEVARDIMKSSNLTRDDLTASIQTDKRVFLDLQLQIMEEQNRRESELAGRPFVSDRGPDPIVYAAMHADQASADRLCAHEAAAACFQRYRTECMVVILCPLPSTVDDGFRLVESREKQDQFNNCLRTLLDQHRIPYLYLGIIDREKRMRALESMLRGTLGVHIEESIKVYPCPLSVAFRASCFTPHSLSPCRTALCRLDVSCESIKISLPAPSDGKTNRMAHRYGAEKMIVVSFDRKVSPRVVKHVIDGGVWVNGTVFHFLGCSSSGLKSRTCYMFQGSKGEIERMLAECFVMKKDTPTSKRMKRIGMLFSELKLTSVVVVDKDVIEMLDIERNGFNFTDGCGGISKDLAEKVKERVGIVEAYLPSVYQIRYQGCKGVVVLDPKLASGKLMIRPSMKKCLSGSKPFLEIGICDYSRPYSYGHLNRQFIMLFSALGIKDEVFIKKQEAHLARLEKLAEDPEVTVQMLYWRNMPELARKVVECQGMLGESKSLKRELMSLQSKLFDKLDRLQIFIPESRCIFGVCDPLGILSYGQCFVRITIAGKPATVVGQVTVAKNPCYLLGDVRVLMAVDEPRLNHLVDCIVFPTRGQRPHPTEMAGSDLDGDQYFVCWDNDLIVPTLREPYTYPEMSGAEDVGSMIDYFAKQQSNMGLIDTYYKFWADYKGIQSAECQGLGKLFSRSVDATKTGDYVNVPKPFLPPKEEFQMWRENHVALCGTSMKVWQILDQKATELYQKRQNSTILNSLQTNMATIISEDFVWHAICNEQRGVSEYQLFLFILQWIDAQQFSCDESAEKLKAFSMHIDFGKFTVDEQKAAVDKGIPLGLVTNALNSSQLLSNTMLQHFLLDVPHLEWHYYTRSAGADVDWQHLIRAVRDFPESLFIFQLFDEAFVCLHFMCSLPTGDNIPLKPGSIASYLFSPHFEYYQRHVLVGNYFISLDDNVLQIYRNGEKRQSFLWLANIHELRKENATMFDRISVDLTQFKGARPKHPLINKQQISYFEVFVKSSNPADAYFDLYEAVQPDIELPMEICSIEDIEELPDDVVESSETGMLSVTVESARSGLDTYAMNGHASQFRAALEVLISVDHALDSTVVTKLFCTLMETLVSKYIHLVRLPNGIIEDLQVILSTMFEHQCFRSAQASIQVMTYLSQLHPTGLAEQFLSSFLHSMQLSQYSEYVDCVCSWKLWCCFPQDIALQLASKIHDLSKSFVTSKGSAVTESLAQLAQSDTPNKSINNAAALMHYIIHFTYLALQSFIYDVTCGTSRDSIHSRDRLQKLKPFSPPSQVELDEGDSPHDSKSWEVGFHGDVRVTQTFRPGTYVRINAMTKKNSLFVGIGRITQLTWNPTVIVTEVFQPIPHCLQQSVALNRGHWEFEVLGNVTLFNREIKALCSLIEEPCKSPLSHILVHPDAFPVSGLVSPSSVVAPSSIISKHCTGDKPQEAHDHFNLSQLEAIRSSLSNRLTLIQGPPGTGKTHVACEIICKQNAKQPDKHILAVAETNMAVDNMTARLQKMGLRVVRVGSEAKISPSIRHLTIEYQVELKQKEEGKRPRRATFPSPRLAKQVLKAAQVVTTTCTGAGDPILDGMQFPFVLIDEATQATELATLIPIVHQCDQLTLIGDPEQLSPNILFGGNNRTDCSVTSVEQLKTTLFHRLQGKVPFHFLNEQHRMHPALCEFPSLQFYSGQLKTAHTPYTYDSIDFYWPDKSRPLLFIDTNSREISNKRSFANEKEANVITDVVKCLLNLKLSPLEIVVLTPYLAQVECIHSKLCEEVVGVEVCTVDSFQGREKDVVIFSTVRCNPGGSVGFVDDRYRMNVLLTRAKRGIIGVGNKTTLCTGSSLWQSWLQFVPCITDKDFYAKMNTRKQCTGNTTPAKGARPFQHERRAKQKKLQRYDAK